jgi:uncharacterized protein (UPF0335 family)
MTLVGKIFTVLVLIMSLCFMSFSLMVTATHKNWKNKVLGENGELGLNKQIEQLEEQKKTLTAEKSTVENELAEERAARRFAIAALETKRQLLQDELTQKLTELATTKAELTAKIATDEVNAVTLQKYMTENESLRAEYKDVLFARDELLVNVNSLTDELHSYRGQLATLEERRAALVADYAKVSKLLYELGYDKDTVLTAGPKVPGVVTAVSERGLVEISLGSDDGVRVGNFMHVYGSRGDYAGKIQIRRVSEDRAVGEIIPETRNRPVKKGDNVATNI